MSRWRAVDAYKVWMTYSGAWSFVQALSWTTTAVYLIRDVHMTPLQLVLAGTAMELAYFLFEIPTGVVADRISRRLSMILAALCMGAAMLLAGAVAETIVVLAAMALWGFGWTFRSGAEDAWLADEVGSERLGAAYQRSAQLARLTGLCGIGAAVALALVDLRLPLLVAGATTWAIAAFLAAAMPERGFRPPDASSGAAWHSVRALATTANSGRRVVAGHPVLMLVLGISLLWGMWSEGFDRLKEAHFLLDVGLPGIFGLDALVWFGVMRAGALVLSFVVAAPLVTRFERLSQVALARLLLGMHALLIVAALSFALAGQVWPALVAYWVTSVARDLIDAPYRTWVNNTITDSSVRSTVLSITNVFGSAGEWGGGPLLGWIGTRWSVRVALATGALLLSPALLLFARAARHQGRDLELALAAVNDSHLTDETPATDHQDGRRG